MTYPGDLPLALSILRMVRGLTQKELAAAAGFRWQSSVCHYERGNRVPELQTLRALLDAMDFTLADLEAVMAFVRMLRGEPPNEATEKRLRGEAVGAALRLVSSLLALSGPPAEPSQRQ